MGHQPYSRFQGKSLILRDELAIDRTLLANENTLLAYLRSALTLVITGVTFIHFFAATWLLWLGVGFVPLGVGVGFFGWRRFRRMQLSINTVRSQHSD